MTMTIPPSKILIPRLRQYVDPFYNLGVKPFGLRDTCRVLPRNFAGHTKRGPTYHRGRVRAILDKIEGGWTMDSIWVDNKRHGSQILPTAFIADGYHRFIAAGLLGWMRISAEYTGRVDVLAYLTGERDQIPC